MPSSIKLLREPLLAPSSTLILITGASGHIGANIVREALNLGYYVRGTARTSEKCKQTVAEQHNHPNYSTAVVSDFANPSDEIDAAVRRVDSIIHVASDTSMNDDADHVINGVVAGTENLLRAAAREPRVKRFTLTSSATAAVLPKPGVEGFILTKDTWNDEAVEAARTKGSTIGPNFYPYVIYGASKTQGERALWKFMRDEEPSFVANAILPDFNTGRIVGSPGATGKIPTLLSQGVRPPIPAQYFIDVVDNSRLHLCAAALDGSLKNERIFAFGWQFNLNDIVDVIKEVRPDLDQSKLKIDPDELRDHMKVPNELGARLLKEWYGQDGYKSLEQSIKENLEGI